MLSEPRGAPTSPSTVPGWTPAVCSWSLRPRDAAELVGLVRRAGCAAVQLHLDPLRGAWDEAETVARLADAGVGIVSGMMTMQGEDYGTLESIRRTGGVRPDGTWPANLGAARANADLAARLGVRLVTFHAGWIPHDPLDPERAVMLRRLATLVEVFAACGVRVGLETGQETAGTLLCVLRELPGASVNFDPANMLLYGMGDPHAALAELAPRVAQIHLKDARRSREPGAWGDEVPLGEGEVDWPRFLRIAQSACPGAGMVIEREAGERRVEDVAAAVAWIHRCRGVTP